MRDRKEEIKRRIAKRKRELNSTKTTSREIRPLSAPEYYDEKDFSWKPKKTNDSPSEQFHPLFNKDLFLMKLLASAILVLLVAILFQNQSDKLDSVRNSVTKVMEQEFQFATVSKWYEDTFGEPLVLLPEPKDNTVDQDPKDFALPANAKIVKNYDSQNQGIVIETFKDAPVEVVQEGTVEFAGEKEGHGKTVIVQHADGSETWYGQLGDISVKVYQQLKAGDLIGTVSEGAIEATGQFYFAVKKDEKFIDPVEVIKFE